MASLANQTISSTYDGLIKTSSDNAVPVSGVQALEDGSGNALALSVGRSGNGVTVSGNLAVDTNTLYVDAANNRVGIGTSSPDTPLHIRRGELSGYVTRSDATLTLENTTATELYLASANDRNGQIRFGDTDSNFRGAISYEHGVDSFLFYTAATERMRIDSSGRVGIGTTPSMRFQVKSSGNTTEDVASFGNANINDGLVVTTNGNLDWGFNARNTRNLTFSTNQSERMRIDSSGNVGIGVVPASSVALDIKESTAGSDLILGLTAGTGARAQIRSFAQSGSTTAELGFYTVTGGNTSERMRIDSSGNVGIGDSNPAEKLSIYQASTSLDSAIRIRANRLYNSSANIYTKYEISPAGAVNSGAVYKWDTGIEGNANGQNFVFKSTSTSGTTERMRIDSSGRVLVNTQTAQNTATGRGNVTINGTTSILNLATSDTNSGYIYHDSTNMQVVNAKNGYMNFYTNDTERMRITSGGILAVGKSTSLGVENAGLYVAPNDFMSYTNTSTDTGDRCVIFNRQSAVGTVVDFRTGNSTKGSITISSSAVAYNTTSDYRLKENVVEMTGALDRVDALKPSRFNFIADPEKTVDGFLAHEVAEVVPEAISGEKDAVDEEGNPIYQGIDQSKIVPLLVGAIKELRAEIELLKSQLS